MSDTPKLVWDRIPHQMGRGNSLTVARSFGEVCVHYYIEPIVKNDSIWFSIGPTPRFLMGSDELFYEAIKGFPTLESAQTWCQAREDDAWRAAHPEPDPVKAVEREYTDAELWAAVEKHTIDITEHLYRAKDRRWSANGHVFAPTPREAVAAFLRSLPVAGEDLKPGFVTIGPDGKVYQAKGAATEQEEEPETDIDRVFKQLNEMNRSWLDIVSEVKRIKQEPPVTETVEDEGEMTVAELEKLIIVNDLVVRNCPDEKPDRIWNVWYRKDYRRASFEAATLETAVRKCVAAIEAEKNGEGK